MSVCLSVCVFVRVFTFEVPFNGLFAPTSWSRMSNIFRDSKSLGKSNGKKWSQIWTFFFENCLKSPRNFFFFSDFVGYNRLIPLRVFAHTLGVERLRYSQPPVPLAKRGCRFCGPPGPRAANGSLGRGPIDDELHAITDCQFMAAERIILYEKMSDICPSFKTLDCQSKFVRLLCPTSPPDCKLINRFISNTFNKRKMLDES